MTHHICYYLRANASSSARLSSDSGGGPIFEFFSFSASPLNITSFPKYSASESVRF
ncbi:hypothetical protein HanXRQr2_Chr14g0655011 [Helianthus annuus]|uniref:Uncharacterized protein n=1 Tax=Helianthus annuus TaxID=4232 RepID=A0A9K3H7L2_HELAN|nr:hypothetical protein HanXRQr2_Chr14g0655011 [Helianthus annuus]KAJ0841219.1 hypothetical protein HanPSC8_Chr14g0627931 [Helianthus annuus]